MNLSDNLNFSPVVQGCMTWGAWGKKMSTAEMAERMNQAVEMGITTFDHADIYGDYTTEIEFGAAFKESGLSREQIQLVTKCGIQYVGKTRKNTIKHYQYDAEYIIWSAEKSIADLKADYLDLFLLHRPSPLMKPQEVAKAVEALYSSGKIKAFGVSNFTPSQTELIRTATPVMFNQIEFSLVQHEAMTNGSLDHMMTQGITPMCWSPLGGIFSEQTERNEHILNVLEELCGWYDAQPDQLLLSWIMKHPAGILPVIGTTSPRRMQLSIDAAKIELSETDWFKLWVASRGTKVP